MTTRPTVVPSIPTRYRSILFRSRLEARWAVAFDAMGFQWVYEPMTYNLLHGRYTPDFLVTTPRAHRDTQWLVEVKPTYPTSRAIDKARALAAHQPCPVLIYFGTDFDLLMRQMRFTTTRVYLPTAVKIKPARRAVGFLAAREYRFP